MKPQDVRLVSFPECPIDESSAPQDCHDLCLELPNTPLMVNSYFMPVLFYCLEQTHFWVGSRPVLCQRLFPVVRMLQCIPPVHSPCHHAMGSALSVFPRGAEGDPWVHSDVCRSLTNMKKRLSFSWHPSVNLQQFSVFTGYIHNSER